MKSINSFIPTLSIFLFCTLLIGHSTITAQTSSVNDSFIAVEFQDGSPEAGEFFFNQLNFESQKFASLQTGDVSVDAIVGFGKQGTNEGYYAILLKGGELQTARLGIGMNEVEEGHLMGEVDLEIDREESLVATLELSHYTDSNTLFYRWPSENGESGVISLRRESGPIQIGQKFPEIQVTSLGGKSVGLSDFEGKYVVINWWASFCAPCIVEMPGLNQLVQNYGDRNDLDFLAIAWDDADRITSFLERREFLFKQTITTDEVTSIFGESFPRHVIIDPDGDVIFDKRGGHKDVHLELEAFLKNHISL